MSFSNCINYFSGDFSHCFSSSQASECVQKFADPSKLNKSWNKALKFLGQALASPLNQDQKLHELAKAAFEYINTFPQEYKRHPKYVRLVREYTAKTSNNYAAPFAHIVRVVSQIPKKPIQQEPFLPQEFRTLPKQLLENKNFIGAVKLYVEFKKEHLRKSKEEATKLLQKAFHVSSVAAMKTEYRKLSLLIHPDKILQFDSNIQNALKGLHLFMNHYHTIASR
jgi:preprotein translocase subunit Sec63